MSNANPVLLSRHLTHLVGRNVVAARIAAKPTAPAQAYGIYKIYPAESALVLSSDLRLLGSLAGSLIGLPDAEIAQQLKSPEPGESLRDAMYEVLNVVSAVIVERGRAVLTSMATDSTSVQDVAASALLQNPTTITCFQVTVDGYQGGRLAILS